jgi:HAD superfamily hydrolase (TIGR01509 family)
MARIRVVLLDIDGTLLDSNDAHAHAWLDALRGHGISVPFERVRQTIGMGGDKLLRALAGIDADSLEGRSITERRTAILKAHYVPDLGPLPGARTLVERLRARSIACAAVTSSNAEERADLLRAAAIADLLDQVITADDADRSKPDPDLIELALERLNLAPEEAMYIGDTPYDVEAAARAGVSAIAFRSGGWSDADLAGAVAIYDGPADLASRLDQSPLGRGEGAPRVTYGRPRRSAARGV